MRFEWDPNKERSNLVKHGFDFSVAKRVFDDPNVLFREDRVMDGEERLHAIGLIDAYRLLVVVHTFPIPERVDLARVISVRRATRNEDDL